MNLDYSKPNGFEAVQGPECFKDNPKLEGIITCAYSQFRSEDGQFMAFVALYPPLNEDDSIFISKISQNGFKGLDRMHESNIQGDIRCSFGDDAAENWREYVDYYPADKARRKFNAGSAISYSLKLNPQDYYQGKYNNLDVLCL